MADSPEQIKLERVLQRFMDSNYKSGASDDIYMEKLLTHLSGMTIMSTVIEFFVTLSDDTVNMLFIFQEAVVHS